MYSPRRQLSPPGTYDFPFEPYEIQKDLMNSVYNAIEHKKIGVFESPTGTGKSLTLTCAALRWLLDHEALVKEDLQMKISAVQQEIKCLDDSVSTDWITSQFQANLKRSEFADLKKKLQLIEEYEQKIQQLKVKKFNEKKRNQGSKHISDSRREQSDEEDHLLNDDEITSEEDGYDEENERIYKDVKIYFCSRTHSQLIQVVREVKRTSYGSQIRCVSLASRQNLCIHSEIRKLSSASLINERCLDMAKNKTKITSTDADGRIVKKSRKTKSSTCPHKSQMLIDDFSECSLVNIFDIEDLVRIGEEKAACPYYSSRTAAKDAQLIMLPYQLLLHRKTRLQSGIKLKNSIIIIDEAHNLLDAINNIYSVQMNLYELTLILEQMNAYKLRYSERFNTKNLLKINQILFIVKRFIKILTNHQNNSECRTLKICEFMSEGEFFNINLYDILQFCENSRLAQKLLGFVQHKLSSNENKKPTASAAVSGAIDFLKKLQTENIEKKAKKVPINATCENVNQTKNSDRHHIQCPIRQLISFLESLTECEEDGRILLNYVHSDTRKTYMKFILLNPGGHFDEIVREARTVIIAGGTLQPTDEMINLLFSGCRDRVIQKFYDHVVSEDAVSPFVVCKGPTGKIFRFNYATKQDKQMIDEFGLALVNLCSIIPAGIICFFSSYDYLEFVYDHFQQMGILEKIQNKKYFFRERQINFSGQTIDKLLIDYSNAIQSEERFGAILFSVVGGKLSEGLNFSDDLGRCVVIVGMPYPDRKSPELQERMNFIESTQGQGAGQEFYENHCMKSVNQCIGRSVRHIRDYASILLFDERYANQKIIKKLPQWIARSLKTPESFGLVQGTTAKFFRSKKF